MEIVLPGLTSCNPERAVSEQPSTARGDKGGTARAIVGDANPVDATHTAEAPSLDAGSVVRAELQRIAERFEAADRRANPAGVAVAFGAATVADREAAEAERRDAAGDFWRAETELADLLCLLLRLAVRHQPDALHALLADALRPELRPLAEAVAGLEARR